MVARNDHTVLDGVTLDVMLATESCGFAMRPTVLVDYLTPNLVSLLSLVTAIQDLPLELIWLWHITFRNREVQSLLRPEPDMSGKHAA